MQMCGSEKDYTSSVPIKSENSNELAQGFLENVIQHRECKSKGLAADIHFIQLDNKDSTELVVTIEREN